MVRLAPESTIDIAPVRPWLEVLASLGVERGTLLLLVTYFPVNFYAAWHGVALGGHRRGPVYLWLHAPLQTLLVGWARVSMCRDGTGPASVEAQRREAVS